MTGSKWVITWFLDGFGMGWLGDIGALLPWTGEPARALTFDTKEDADRWLVQLVLTDAFWPEMEVQELTKEDLRV